MKKLLLVCSLAMLAHCSFAQNDSPTTKKKKTISKDELTGRAADHFLLQLGYNGWASKPDSLKTKGCTRTFNFYLLFDFPFKTDPRFSVAIGAGVGSDHMFFDKTTIDLRKTPISFASDTINKYKKYKLTTGYLEAPVELRFSSNPVEPGKSFKLALGVKVGTMVDAHTKAKLETDASGYGGYVTKLKDKRNFNGTRLAATVRVGYGVFSLFGTYQVNKFIREGFGPDVKPYSIGLTISGL